MSAEARDHALLQTLVEALEAGLPGRIRHLSLYGDAVGPAYRPGASPLTTALVIDDMLPERLSSLRSLLHRRRLRRLPVPLLMDPAYIESSLDVFPLEFLEIRDRHRTLLGDPETFERLELEPACLRRELEQQLKGKLLHLRAAYLRGAGSRRRMLGMLGETTRDFELLLRGLLYLAGRPRPGEPDRLLREVETAYAIELPVLARLQAAARGRTRIASSQAEQVVLDYLVEARSLARLADAL